MANTQNLKPYRKGVSGNPKGRPPSRPLKQALLEALAEKGGQHQALKKISSTLIKEAEKGNMTAIKLLFERLDGPSPKSSQIDAASFSLSTSPQEALLQIQKAVREGFLDLDVAIDVRNFVLGESKEIEDGAMREMFSIRTTALD